MYTKVTDENAHTELWNYTNAKYGARLMDYFSACTLNLDTNNPEFIYKQILTWLIYYKRDPDGRSVIDEFVEQCVDEPDLKTKILRAKDATYEEYIIKRAPDANKIMLVEPKQGGGVLAVEIMGTDQDMYMEGRSFTGTVHPWHENGTHRITGISTILRSDEEMFEKYKFITPGMTDKIFDIMQQDYQKDAESITIAPGSKARTLLVKLPVEWVDGICSALGVGKSRRKRERVKEIASVLTSEDFLKDLVSKLSEDEKIALRLVLHSKDSSVRYANLCRRVGQDDTTWNWDEKPQSVVGGLRRFGLLIVGRKRIDAKDYKVAAVPADVAVLLKSHL